MFIEGLSPDYDTIAGDSGRDTLRGGEEDIVSGGDGNDRADLDGAPDALNSIERFAKATPAPNAGLHGSLLNLYRDDRRHMILQAAVRLSDSGWAVDWDFKQSSSNLIVNATTYRRGVIAAQAIWTYFKSFDLGPAFGEDFVLRMKVNEKSTIRKAVTVNSRSPGAVVPLGPLQDFNIRQLEGMGK